MVRPIENEDKLMLGVSAGYTLQTFMCKHTNAFQFSFQQKAGVYGYPHVWTIIANFANTIGLMLEGSASYVLILSGQPLL